MGYVKSNGLVYSLIRLLILIVTGASLVSCQSGKIKLSENSDTEMRVVYASSDLSLDAKIERLLDEDKNSMALQLILENHLETDNTLTEMVLGALDEEKERYLEEKLFDEALRVEKSLIRSGLRPEVKDSSKSLIQNRIQKLIGKEKYLEASLLLERYEDDFGTLPDDFLKEAELVYLKTGNRRGLARIEEYYQSLGEQDAFLDPESVSFLVNEMVPDDLLKGTVTVWVDRGIKIENGLGMPDRVIGSGFFVSEEGYLLTNYHVIESEVNPEYEGYSRLYIKLSDERGERIPAKVIGWDRILDLAVLKAEIAPPYVFHLSDEDAGLGDSIFAIGSPGGLVNSITSGTVSAKGRILQAIGESIQIDVPINPGNSGGPLLNHKNEVVGVVFAGIESFENTNFAIPVNYVKKVLPGLLKGGAYIYPWTGIGVFEDTEGVQAAYIVPGSPASTANIKKGDRLVSVNGEKIQTRLDAQKAVLKEKSGTLIQTEWENNGERKEIFINLEQRPDKPLLISLDKEAREDLFLPFFGMDVEYYSGSVYKRYRITEVYTGSIADEAHLSSGDMFTLRKWYTDLKQDIVLIQIIMSNRKAGFIESAIQFGNTIESAIFF